MLVKLKREFSTDKEGIKFLEDLPEDFNLNQILMVVRDEGQFYIVKGFYGMDFIEFGILKEIVYRYKIKRKVVKFNRCRYCSKKLVDRSSILYEDEKNYLCNINPPRRSKRNHVIRLIYDSCDRKMRTIRSYDDHKVNLVLPPSFSCHHLFEGRI